MISIGNRCVISVILVVFSILDLSAHENPSGDSICVRQKTKMIAAVSTGTLGAFAVPYFSYVNDDVNTDFHFFNDNKGYLQVDKLVHSFQSYFATSLWYKGLKNAGMTRSDAILFGGFMGFILLTPKEIFDGFDGYAGFSWGDLLANAAGPAFFVGQELLFEEQTLKFKFSFSRSPFADQSNGLLGRNVLMSYFKDYNGHTYWLSLNANRLLPKSNLPDWLSIAAGYSANGMFGIFENADSWYGVAIPETERYRQFLISLDVDWSKINVKSGFLRFLLNGLNYIKIPFPALEINSLGHIKGYYLYF